MNSVRNIARLNDVELQNVTPSNASWHTDYRDTAYIYIGGLPFELSEGDVLLIFSQYGNPKHIKLMRDNETGKSRGFAWLKYEDQRSTDLAVDNLSGAQVLGRTLSVDHTRYKLKDGEKETVGEEEGEGEQADTDREEGRRRKITRTSESESEEERPMLKEEVELAKLMREHDDDDPMKTYLVEEKKAEVQEALKALAITKPKRKSGETKHRHRHRHRERRARVGDSDDEERTNGHHVPKSRGRGLEKHRKEEDRSGRRWRSRSRDEDPLSDDTQTRKRKERHRRRREDSDG